MENQVTLIHNITYYRNTYNFISLAEYTTKSNTVNRKLW